MQFFPLGILRWQVTEQRYTETLLSPLRLKKQGQIQFRFAQNKRKFLALRSRFIENCPGVDPVGKYFVFPLRNCNPRSGRDVFKQIEDVSN